MVGHVCVCVCVFFVPLVVFTAFPLLGANHFLFGILYPGRPRPPLASNCPRGRSLPSYSLLGLWVVIGREESPASSPA